MFEVQSVANHGAPEVSALNVVPNHLNCDAIHARSVPTQTYSWWTYEQRLFTHEEHSVCSTSAYGIKKDSKALGTILRGILGPRIFQEGFVDGQTSQTELQPLNDKYGVGNPG